MIVQKKFIGGLNSDYSELEIEQNQYEYALNIRNGSDQNKSFGVITNIKGNEEIPIPEELQYLFAPSLDGDVVTKTVGAYTDNKTATIFWLVKNGDNFDFILSFSIKTEVVSLVLQDNSEKTNFVKILNLSLDYPITSFNLVDGILYYTDGNVDPRALDVNDLSTGSYDHLNPIVEIQICAAKPRPHYPPGVVPRYDPAVAVISNINKKTFQFRYLYIFENNERSVYSPVSERTVTVFDYNLGYDSDSVSTYIDVSFKIDQPRVKAVELIAREANNDWLVIDTIYKASAGSPDGLGNYYYQFANDHVYSPADQVEAALLFDYLPQKASTQELVNGTNILYGNMVEGYDNVDITGVSFNWDTDLHSASETQKQWKSGSKYRFGVVYFDKFGRSSATNTLTTAEVFTPVNHDNHLIMKFSGLSFTPPEWAYSYQIYATNQLTHEKFFYFRLDGVDQRPDPLSDGVYSWAVFLNAMNVFNKAFPASKISYQFEEGDRLRVHDYYDTGTSSFVKTYKDFEILAFDAELADEGCGDPYCHNRFRLSPTEIGTGGADPITGYSLVEIYTPKKPTDASESVYFGVGKVYAITNPGEVGRFHSVTADTIQGQVGFSDTINTGDVYIRHRKEYPSVPTSLSYDVLVEDMGYSDFYTSNFDSMGMPNIVDPNNKQQLLTTQIRFSENKVIGTAINGLSRFYQLSAQSQDITYGPIRRLMNNDNYLVCFQDLHTSSIPVYRNIVEDSTGGANQVLISEKLLNTARYYSGNFGIGHNAATLVKNDDGYIYFVSDNKKCVCRLAGDGINNISKEARMNTFFTSLIAAYSQTGQRVVAGIDPKYNEYVVSFLGDQQFTVSFNEKLNIWSSFFSYIPEFFVSFENNFYSFFEGGIWIHDSNDVDNNSFYGSSITPSEIDFIFNPTPAVVKTFLSLYYDSNLLWKLIDTGTGPGVETSLGNQSILDTPDFEIEKLTDGSIINNKEGVFYADFKRAVNSIGGIYEGDFLKGQWIRVRMTNSGNNFVYLWSVFLGFSN